jgi:hypothetical protein
MDTCTGLQNTGSSESMKILLLNNIIYGRKEGIDWKPSMTSSGLKPATLHTEFWNDIFEDQEGDWRILSRWYNNIR